ncbi:MAG: diaminopimelate epimerase [Myxococcota bacterium]|nr:diaminopimelate epimerase [Myxococcota bacterium]
MRLIKSHGLGNDYLVLDSGGALSAERVRTLCHRNEGIGADGILEPVGSDQADHGLRIWNPDGSQAEKSGNGLRIFARWLVDHRGAPAAFTVEVPAGIVSCSVDGETGRVTVDMGTAMLEPPDVPCTVALRDSPTEVAGATLRLTAVGMGNPHCVVLVEDADLDGLPWRTWGRLLETDPRFPNRTNVQVARVIDRGNVDARIWERGAGETLASGSSACAVAVAARLLGRVDGAVTVHMPGGPLQVQVDADLRVSQTGPVVEVCTVDVSLPLPE